MRSAFARVEWGTRLSGCGLGVCAQFGCGWVFLVAGCAGGPQEAPSALLVPALRIAGRVAKGELGFRFGPPRDVDGDGVSDLAAGARFTDLEFTQMGSAAVWSSADGRELARWDGAVADALFGHAVLVGPDADRDGLADVVVAAPNGRYGDVYRGALFAYSPRSGKVLWSRLGEPYETLGWHLALAGDQDGDGVEDVFAGAPVTGGTGKVYLIGGRDGAVLRVFPSPSTSTGSDDLFGWYASATGDLDGDGRQDLVVGAPSAQRNGVALGAAYAISTASGKVLHSWHGRHPHGEFGQVVCGLDDLDGDGAGEVAVAEPRREAPGAAEKLLGEVTVFSGRSGERLFHWVGVEPGELYGRMVASAPDLDGDGVRDIAVGAPWSTVNGMEKAGRFEVRSGRNGSVLFEAWGDRTDGWLGWHIEAGEGLGPERRRGLVVSALRSAEGSKEGAGALVVFVDARSRRVE